MIYGEGVRLRAIERSDLPTFVRWFNDPEVRQFLLMYAPMSMAMEERWFENRLNRENDHLFAVEAQVNETWVHVGNVGLHQIDWKNRLASFGIALGEKAYWNRGFGTAATRTIVRFAFAELNLHRVELEVFESNLQAMRCYEKAGFQREGVRRQAFFRDGRYHDLHVMAILAPEFAAAAAR